MSAARMRRVLVAGMLGGLAACANMRLEPSGFLPEFERLERAPDLEVAFIPDEVRRWQAHDRDLSAYSRVLVEAVQWRPVGDRAKRVDPDRAAELCRDFGDTLEDHLGRELPLADSAAPGAIAVRAAITDVVPSNVALNVVSLILLFPVDMGGIRGEIELVDAATGRPLEAYAAYREGTPFLLLECFSRYGHAHHGMKKWAKMIGRSIRPQATGENPASRRQDP